MGKVLEEMVASCNLPGGVFAEVYGEAGEGAELISADVDLVWFTGSTSTGRTIQQQTGPRFIKTVLELGGSAPGIVCEDADIEQAAESIYLARFTNCGQVCDGLKRLIVHESIVNELLVKLTTILSSKVVGDPQLPTTDLGPLVSEGQLARLLAQMEDAKSKGAEVITGGYQPDLQGYYYVPTLLTNISKDMTIWREETFGPVLPIVTFRDDTQAAQLANDTDYGLGAYIYSGNVERATQLAQQIETGMVAINSAYYLLPCNPFGGSKATGGGRAHGPFAFHEICNQKVIARPICR